MRKRFLSKSSIYLLVSIWSATGVHAQNNRTQYPGFLSNKTYFEASVGYINYHFSNAQLMPGYTVESVHVPHVGVRLILYGYQFNKNLSAQVTYLRPVLWIRYNNVNGDHQGHSVTMNIAGFTLKSSFEINKKISLYAEGGMGIVTRTGFEINHQPVIKGTGYISLQAGGGLDYRLTNKWGLKLYGGWSPANSKKVQPATIFFSGGVRYNMRRLTTQQVEANRNSGYIFPENLLQVSVTSSGLGYGVNNFVSNPIFPIFWGGDVQVGNGFSVNYQRNIFHSRKIFSVDLGSSISYWKSKIQKTGFYTISVYPQFRFTVLRSKATDLYFNYSVAGPTYISRERIDETETGKHFTFRDFMGMGIYTGKHRNMNAEISIGHFSNGDLFPQNNGVKVPLTFNLGYAF